MTLTIGQKAKYFSLPGVDGRNHSLTEFKDKKAALVIFSCNHCPYVQAYEDRIMDIQRDYQTKGLQVIAINSNDSVNYPEDSFENMVKRAKERQFNFLYLRDETQQTARDYGATHTPHLFLLDGSFALCYTGKIDDNWQEPGKVTQKYLRDALDAVLDGKPVPRPETHAIGCTIKWR